MKKVFDADSVKLKLRVFCGSEYFATLVQHSVTLHKEEDGGLV